MSHVTTIERSRIALALAFLLASCGPAVNEVRVEPGTAVLKPIFVLTDTTGVASSGVIYGLAVVPCGADTAVWQIAANGSHGAPGRLAYGDTVPGYITNVGPGPLKEGCYNVFVTDGRRARFRIDAAGRVVGTTPRDTTHR